MNGGDWQTNYAKTIGVFLNGDALPWQDPRGHPVRSASFFMVFNAHHEPIDVTFPAEQWGKEWTAMIDTAVAHRPEELRLPGDARRVEARSFVLFKRSQ